MVSFSTTAVVGVTAAYVGFARALIIANGHQIYYETLTMVQLGHKGQKLIRYKLLRK